MSSFFNSLFCCGNNSHEDQRPTSGQPTEIPKSIMLMKKGSRQLEAMKTSGDSFPKEADIMGQSLPKSFPS